MEETTYTKSLRLVPFEERLFCSKCDTEMKWDRGTLLSHPTKYRHTCPKCEYTELFYASYPRIVHKIDSVTSV